MPHCWKSHVEAHLLFKKTTSRGPCGPGSLTSAQAHEVDVKILIALLAAIYRGSYMSAHVLLNLLNELRKRDKCEASRAFLYLFRNEFDKFNNTGSRMLNSFYHMTLKLL